MSRGRVHSLCLSGLLPLLWLAGLCSCASHIEHTVAAQARGEIEPLLREALADLESGLPVGQAGGVVQPLVEVLRPDQDWLALSAENGELRPVDLGLEEMDEHLERTLIAALDASPRHWQSSGGPGDPVMIARLEVYYDLDPQRAVYLVDCFYEGSSVRAAGHSSLLGIRPPYCVACDDGLPDSADGDDVDVDVGLFFWLGGLHHHGPATYIKVHR